MSGRSNHNSSVARRSTNRLFRATAPVRPLHTLRSVPESRQQSGGASSSATVRVSDENMRVLKRMRPEELREISRAAAALEKTKIEEKKKVDAFVAKTENLVALVDNCYICMEPLLNNIGTSKFGVLSWRCRCSVPQKAHSACLFSKVCHGQGTCDMCHSPMLFEKTRRRGSKATLKFHRPTHRMDENDASSSDGSEFDDHQVFEEDEDEDDDDEDEEDENEDEAEVEDDDTREDNNELVRAEIDRQQQEARERRRQREIRRLQGWSWSG